MTSLIGSWKIAEFGSGDDQAAFMIGPSMMTSALMYFHSATSSLRASATIFAFLEAAAVLPDPVLKPQGEAERGWWRSHIQASSTIVVRSSGLPAFETPWS